MDKNLEEYKKYVSARLAALTPIFAKASIGDFSEKLEVPDGEDEFVQLYAGVGIMLEVMRQQLTRLNDLNNSLSGKVEELQFIQDQVEQEKNLDEAIIESIGDGVIVTDKDLQITMINYQAQLLLGIPEKEASLKPLYSILRAVDDKSQPILDEKRATTIAMNEKKKHSINYFYLKQDNTPLPVSVTASPVLLGGKVAGVIVVFKDRTKDRVIEELKNEFISLAAHQLRSPLSTMRWNIELFQKQNEKLSPDSQDKIASVYKNVQKMITLVNDMLSVSRIDQGRDLHTIEEVDIVGIVNDILSENKVVADAKMVEVIFTPPNNNFPKIKADKKKLRDVIQNLVNNSVKFNTPLGKMEILLSAESDKVKLEISDTGIGIPAQDAGRLFEKFYRASNAVLGQTPGTGLGLFLVRTYVGAWGGKVWFESPANARFRAKVGKFDNPGSSFYLEFKAIKGGDL